MEIVNYNLQPGQLELKTGVGILTINIFFMPLQLLNASTKKVLILSDYFTKNSAEKRIELKLKEKYLSGGKYEKKIRWGGGKGRYQNICEMNTKNI